MLSGQEQEVAKSLVTIIRSEKYKDRNYLFLEPFDLSQVPGYLDVVPKPLDLRTVANNLDSGRYDSMDAFLEDLNMIFQNAIKYHGQRAETKWIAKMAKDMMKAVRNEKARIENPQKKPTIKLKLGKQLPKAANSTNTSASAETPSAVTSQADPPPPSSEEAPLKKTKLKLKLSAGKNSAAANPPKAIKAKPTQPKLKLKLSLNKPKPVPAEPPVPPQVASAPAEPVAPPSAPLPPPPAAAAPIVEEKKKKVSKKDKAKDKPPKEKIPKEKSPKETKEKKKDAKLSVKINAGGAGGSRGKELPKGVVAPAPSATPKSTTSISSAKTPTASSSTATKTPASNKASSKAQTGNKLPMANNEAKQRKTKLKKSPMSQPFFRQCHKVILGLKRRQPKDISWFLNPVAKNILQDYRSKIKQPMDISRITTKLENGSYSNLPDFVLDVRRISANCLRYNTSMKDSIRQSAVNVLKTAEDLMLVFLTGQDFPPYPRLLYCWTLCINVLDTLCNIVNPTDGQPTVLYFLHPVSAYFGGQFPAGYREKVSNPMDFGTVVSNLVEGRYQSVAEFASDCRLIIQNTKTYYGDKEDGKMVVEQAERLDQVLSQQLDQLARYDKSTKAQTDRQKASVPQTPIQKPPIPLLLSILDEMRALKYTDNATKITEPAMGPFEKPVSLTAYPDYMQHVAEPMDLTAIDKRVKSGGYDTPEDFEYDMTLTFRNCEVYNAKRNGDHYVKMAKFAARHFRRIFCAKMRTLEDPVAAPVAAESGEVAEAPAKKVKVESSSPAATGSKGKTAPRITLSSAAVNALSPLSPPSGSNFPAPPPPRRSRCRRRRSRAC